MDTHAVSDNDETASVHSDAVLLDRLRGGDQRAYEELWSRNVGAALRVARRYDPSRADDLVSEAFLAVYEQVAVLGKGPQSSFRAYLFTVIRNSAAKHARDDLVTSDPDLDVVDDQDAAALLTSAEEAAELISTFKALPDRWQRVLWMSEVDGAPRADIARTLDIRPNAVSALLRRARRGLQGQWLASRVPAALASNPHHVAGVLSDYVMGVAIDIPKRAVAVHLRECRACSDVYDDLRTAHGRMRTVTLSTIGFAALGVTLPTSAPVPAAAASGAAVVGLLTLGTGSAGVGVAVACGGLVTALVTGAVVFGGTEVEASSREKAPSIVRAQDAGASDHARRVAPTPGPSAPAAPSTPDDTAHGTDQGRMIGRGNLSPDVPSLDVEFDFDTLVTPRPLPTPATPVKGVSATPPAGADDEEAPRATLTSAPPSTTYLPPVLAGTADNATAVYVSLADNVYLAPPDDAGRWSFDTATVPLSAGEHDVDVWATDADGVAGSHVSATFSLMAVEVAGFEDTSDLTIAESSTSGIVFTVLGPAGGTVCIDSDSGQSVEVPLDAAGTATRRIRLLAAGFYTIAFTACGSGSFGVATERSLYVDDPSVLWSPFGDRRLIEVSDPAED